jgi:hypothetical protein
LLLFGLLLESLLVAVPLLMRVDAAPLRLLESRCFVAVCSHTERGASGLALAAPWPSGHILPAVMGTAVVRLDDLSLEYTYWLYCKLEVVDDLSDEGLAETVP